MTHPCIQPQGFSERKKDIRRRDPDFAQKERGEMSMEKNRIRPVAGTKDGSSHNNALSIITQIGKEVKINLEKFRNLYNIY